MKEFTNTVPRTEFVLIMNKLRDSNCEGMLSPPSTGSGRYATPSSTMHPGNSTCNSKLKFQISITNYSLLNVMKRTFLYY